MPPEAQEQDMKAVDDKPYLHPGEGGAGGGEGGVTPCWLFGSCFLTRVTLKLILYDFSSNFILNMWPVNTGALLGDRPRLSLIMELSIHCNSALVLEIGCKFGYLIAA